ncbi:hypothetical protein QR680_010109 [Steinernema hermaphroditum]|uniref:Uncharacterized protein n=1 Tax=Steinernema hermaphroditum TaxID=289476 RepID=A0AA39IQD6_9BILA|nr:hypothetical protein QR680_010109 [Steinernema hermaphroditum]
MASDGFTYVINLLLDISAAVHVPINLFAMGVVAQNTPLEMRYFGWTILNIMFWNFGCNFIFAFVHIKPMYPAECYRLDGLVKHFLDSEFVSQGLFCIEFVCVFNCLAANSFIFPLRYFSLVHKQRFVNIKPIRIAVGFAVVIIAIDFGCIINFLQWKVPYDEYPYPEELPSRKMVFCLMPDGFWHYSSLVLFLFLILETFTISRIFTTLIMRFLRKMEGVVHKKTLDIQRKLLKTIIFLTSFPVVFALIPLVVVDLALLFRHCRYTQEITMVVTVIAANHGVIYAVATLCTVHAYRKAVKNMLLKMFRRNTMHVPHVHAFLSVTHKY